MAERTVVTKVSNAVLYSDGSIRVDKGRMSYPHIGEPGKSDKDDGTTELRYSVDLMLPKATHGAAKELIKKAIENLLAEKKDKVGTSFWFLKDGDKMADEAQENGKDREVCRGMWVVRVSEKRRPSVRDLSGNKIVLPDAKVEGRIMSVEDIDEMFYGGAWANVLLRPWYFNGKGKNGKTYNKRISANFLAIQKCPTPAGQSDDSFGEGRISDDGVFDSYDDGSGDGLGDDDEL